MELFKRTLEKKINFWDWKNSLKKDFVESLKHHLQGYLEGPILRLFHLK